MSTSTPILSGYSPYQPCRAASAGFIGSRCLLASQAPSEEASVSGAREKYQRSHSVSTRTCTKGILASEKTAASTSGRCKSIRGAAYGNVERTLLSSSSECPGHLLAFDKAGQAEAACRALHRAALGEMRLDGDGGGIHSWRPRSGSTRGSSFQQEQNECFTRWLKGQAEVRPPDKHLQDALDNEIRVRSESRRTSVQVSQPGPAFQPSLK